MEAFPPKAVPNHFPHNRGRGVETPLPNDSSKAFISPQVGGRFHSFRRDWKAKKLFIQSVKHYHQWLRTAIPLKTKLGQISTDNIRIQGPFKKTKLWPNASSLFCQRTLSKGWKM